MKTLFSIPELDCPHELQMCQRALSPFGVTQLVPDYEARSLWVTHPDSINPDALLAAIQKEGLEAKNMTPGDTVDVSIRIDAPVDAINAMVAGITVLSWEEKEKTLRVRMKRHDVPELFERLKTLDPETRLLPKPPADTEPEPWLKFGVALGLALIAEGLDLWLEHGERTFFDPAHIAMVCLSLVAIFMVGLHTVWAGLKQMMRGQFTMNGLMAIAVLGGLTIGVFPEAAMVMVLFEISEAIESKVLRHAQRSIHHLLDTTPPMADVLDSQGHHTPTPVEYVLVGTRVRVSAGSRVPLDGKVVSGTASLDESMLTGESLPVSKTTGDELWGGTIVQTGSIEMVTTATHEKSLAQRLTEAVKEAQANQSHLERFVDQFARYYTPAVLGIALTIALMGGLITHDWLTWIYRALVMLVIACPCALVISTPVTILSALALASRHGLLIKGGQYLELARQIAYIGLDKTGTLTQGSPRVMDVWTDGLEVSLQFAVSLAMQNNHPLSDAIGRWGKNEKITFLALDNITPQPGVGVQAQYQGMTLRMGRPDALLASVMVPHDLQAFLDRHREDGHALVVLVDIMGARAAFALHDPLKPGAKEALASIQALGMEPILLTGDHEAAGKHVATTLGIRYCAQLTPEDKLRAIESLKLQGRTAMVGDGMNDAPALATADLGIVMGVKGSPAAMQAAHVALMDDRLEGLISLREISLRTHRVLQQNIAIAIGIKVVFMVLASLGLATMWMAVFADTGTCLIVVSNGLRLLREAKKVKK